MIDRRRRSGPGGFATAFTAAPALCPDQPGGRSGRRSHDDGSLRPLRRTRNRTREGAPFFHPFPCTLGSPEYGRHARFVALLPPGVRSPATPGPGQGEVAEPVLSWAFIPSRASSSTIPGPVSSVTALVRDKPSPTRLRELSHLARVARSDLRPWGLEPRIHWLAGPIEPACHRQAATPSIHAFATHEPPVASPIHPCEADGACCLRPLSAAPRASHATFALASP